MNWSRVMSTIVGGGIAGGALGLLVGLLLLWGDVIDNPFWPCAIGIALGSAVGQAMASIQASPRGQNPAPGAQLDRDAPPS